MAKKSTTKSTTVSTNRDMVKVCAFWGLAVSSIMYVFSGVIKLIIKLVSGLDSTLASLLGTISSVATLLASIALVVAIAIPAYGYVKGKKKGWRIFYWIALAVYVLGVVLGALPSIL